MNFIRRTAITELVAAPLAAGCAPSTPWIAYGKSAMVATDHADASRAGAEVLRRGGNAVDAALATSFALAVTRPESTGLGGGGFLIARMAESGEIFVFDYRETAPAAASSDMFDRAVAAQPQRAPPSRHGHLAVAVPGLLSGLALAHEKLGTLPLAELIAPAITLAEDGFPVDEHYVEASRDAQTLYKRYPELRDTCPYVNQVHLRSGRLRRPGEMLRQPALARLLRAITEAGPDVMRTGPVAAAIEQEMSRHGGIITRDDLADYRVIERSPLVTTYRKYEIIGMPSPSSGGICIAETLNILEAVDLARLADTNPRLADHFIVEAMKHAFADRARWLADADFTHVPQKLLTSKAYARQLADALDPQATSESETYGALQIPDDAGTSHFSIVDRWGNCVVGTETINTSFGSLAAVAEWGLILNNEMDDFTAHPGQANAYGLAQAGRNAVEPNKRPLSSMSPTIVLRDGRPVLLLGASGGPRIISSVLNVMLGVLDFGRPLQQAMQACRLHHQWRPDMVHFDQTPDPTVTVALRLRGHQLADKRLTGIVQAILCTEDALVGASDPRNQGRPAGY